MTEDEDTAAQGRLEAVIAKQGRPVPRSHWHRDPRTGMYWQTMAYPLDTAALDPAANAAAALRYMKARYGQPQPWAVWPNGDAYTRRRRRSRFEALRFLLAFARQHGLDCVRRAVGR